MALVVYPTTDWDSYVSLIDAEAILLNIILDLATWNALTDPQKEFYLRQATQLIKLKITDPEETSTPSDLELATCHLAYYSIGKDMTTSDSSSTNVKVLKIAGAIEKEYFSKGVATNTFPDIVKQLLIQYDYSSSAKIYRS